MDTTRPGADLEEVADEASLTPQQVIEVRAAARASTSLDAPVGDTDDAVFGDFVAGDEPLPEETVEVRMRKQALWARSPRSPSASARSSRSATASTAGSRARLEEIGRCLGLTRERVRQIELESLRRLALVREMQAVQG